jgi:O-antigen ligase
VVLRGVPMERAIKIWAAAAIVVAGFAAFSYATKGASGAVSGSTFRLRQTYGGASLFEGWLVLFSLLYWRPSRLTYALAVLGLAGLLLTNHRSAFLALGVACIFHAVFNRSFASRALSIVALCATVLLVVSMVSPVIWTSTRYSLTTMLNPHSDTNADTRVVGFSEAMTEFTEYPFGDALWRNVRYALGDAEPHSMAAQILSQEGVIGAAFWLALFLVAFGIAWRNRARDRLSATQLTYLVFFVVFCLLNTNIRGVLDIGVLAFCVASILLQDERLRAALPRRRAALSPELRPLAATGWSRAAQPPPELR